MGRPTRKGIALIERLVQELGLDCDFERLPAFTYPEDPQRVSAIEEEVEGPSRSACPPPSTARSGCRSRCRGRSESRTRPSSIPRKFCLGLAHAIDGNSGRAFEQTRALDIRLGFPVTVSTEHGDLRADHVVVATQLPFLDPAGVFARTSPSRSYALAVTLADPARPGMYLSADAATRSVRPLVGGANQAVLAGEEHKVGHGPDTRTHYQALKAWARERFQVQSVEHRWSAQDYLPADNVPYIGRLIPGYRRLHVATGFKKWA